MGHSQVSVPEAAPGACEPSTVGMGHMGGSSGNMLKAASPDQDGACRGGGRQKAGSHGHERTSLSGDRACGGDSSCRFRSTGFLVPQQPFLELWEAGAGTCAERMQWWPHPLHVT